MMRLLASGKPSDVRGELNSPRLTVTVFAKKINGPLSLRKAFKWSLSELADALAQLTGRWYDKSTLGKYEKAHAGEADWTKHGASKPLRQACESLIKAYVEARSRGRYTARVTGVRTWRVRLVEVHRAH